MRKVQYEGTAELERLKAHMKTLHSERKQGTGEGWGQDYFRGLLHGLSLADAITASVSLPLHDFINDRGYERR